MTDINRSAANIEDDALARQGVGQMSEIFDRQLESAAALFLGEQEISGILPHRRLKRSA
jgi:hypothetical protein